MTGTTDQQARDDMPPPRFVPSALQEGRVAQDIGRRLDLTEELLRREQIASFR